jgi:hypothetical protein
VSALHVYGVIRASHRDPSAEGVRLVQDHELIAVAREIDDDALLNDDDVRSYLNVLIDLLPGGPVVPVQFGTVAPDEDAVREEILQNTGEQLARCLDRLEGMVELRVRIEANPEAEIEKLLEVSPDLKRVVHAHSHDETLDFRVKLGRHTSLQLAERRDELSDHVLSRLSINAEAHAFLATSSVTELYQAYLVRADKVSDFDGAVSALREELGDTYEVEYVGPLPAFDFTDVEIDPNRQPHRWGWT